jgi:hypothetical protein
LVLVSCPMFKVCTKSRICESHSTEFELAGINTKLPRIRMPEGQDMYLYLYTGTYPGPLYTAVHTHVHAHMLHSTLVLCSMCACTCAAYSCTQCTTVYSPKAGCGLLEAQTALYSLVLYITMLHNRQRVMCATGCAVLRMLQNDLQNDPKTGPCFEAS